MAEVFNLETYSDVNSPSSTGTSLDTGDLRRRFNFGDRVSELSIAQDPFFRFVSKVGKKPTDDPSFKFTEKRPSFHKRYAYVTGWGATSTTAHTDATLTPTSMVDTLDGILYVSVETDYKSSGNIQNIFNNSSNSVAIGSSGTQPNFFLEDQLVKIPFQAIAGTTAATAFNPVDYYVGRVESIIDDAANEAKILKLRCVRPVASANVELSGWGADATPESHPGEWNAATLSAFRIHDQLEKARCYVVGNAHAEGSGYPETWKDQPYSTGYGFTQIWKTTMAMSNTSRATVLKYDGNEWARIWKEKLIEHKWDIEQSLLFSTQTATADGVNYTQGAVDWILNKGNIFTLDVDSKTQDDFLDDLSSYIDPRYNSSSATVFFCSTDVYNWMHKLSGYFRNNLELSSNFRADFSITGKKKVFGVDVSTISTVYGDMNVARNIHLDGSQIKMLGINMNHCKYRPLVGNGVNRDTSVYVGVQTLENSGVDRRVDQILTEAGMEWQMPEAHAVWKV